MEGNQFTGQYLKVTQHIALSIRTRPFTWLSSETILWKFGIPDESFSISHDKRGILSMANKGRHSNGSQFFITLQPSKWMDTKYVAFGFVFKSMPATMLRFCSFAKETPRSPWGTQIFATSLQASHWGLWSSSGNGRTRNKQRTTIEGHQNCWLRHFSIRILTWPFTILWNQTGWKKYGLRAGGTQQSNKNLPFFWNNNNCISFAYTSESDRK